MRAGFLAVGFGLAGVVTGSVAVAAASARAVPELVGVVAPDLGPAVPCLTAAEEQAIHAQLAENRARLAARGELLRPEAGFPVLFGWPLRLNPVIDDPGFHTLVNYVDHDPAAGFRLDPQCGPRTYDLPTYNHTGTDLMTWPYRWLRMDRDDVQIVAAAAGQIIGKVDGAPDESCGFGSSAWNAVYIQHADGSQAWYGHMKEGSTTAKPEGAMVVRGEVLGTVGSSGNSTSPHLHFQVFDWNGQLIDPYAGPCNNFNVQSWWASQRPYNDSAVNALRTHDTPPEFPPCPLREIPHERNAFLPGEEIFLSAFYRDQLAGQVGQYVVRDAVGTPVFTWSHSSPQPYYAASLWYWRITAPNAGVVFGNWSFEVTFQGVTTSHAFWVGSLIGVPSDDLAGARLALALRGANPRRGAVELEASLPAGGVMQLTIVDTRGRTIARLGEGWRAGGRHVFRWEAQVPAGVYLARLSVAGGPAVTRKIVVAD